MGGKETRDGKSFEPVGERKGNREVKVREVMEGQREADSKMRR